jgi:anthranilate phosphoribosyltransferase
MKSFVLISLREPREKEVLRKLCALKEVREAHVLFGEWDLLAEVEIDNTEKLGLFVLEKIRSISEVKLTSTLIVAK